MATLSEYLLNTRRLVRDANAQYWSDAELTTYINWAMKQRDRDSLMNRSIQTTDLTIDQNLYQFNASPFNVSTIDVLSIIVLYGNMRVRLEERVYEEAASLYQPTSSYSGLPTVFAKFGANQVYIAPMPNQAYEAEFDTAVVATDLTVAADADPLPYPWTDPVPFLAAHFARYSLQQYDEAEAMMKAYNDRMTGIFAGARSQMVPYPYSGSRSSI